MSYFDQRSHLLHLSDHGMPWRIRLSRLLCRFTMCLLMELVKQAKPPRFPTASTPLNPLDQMLAHRPHDRLYETPKRDEQKKIASPF